MEEYKVVLLMAYFGEYPAENMEKEINKIAKDGWSLYQVTSGGEVQHNFVYLVFKRTV